MIASIAQRIEQQFPKLKIAGSNPARGASRHTLAHWVDMTSHVGYD